jgi:hypothetical protein
VIDCDTARQLMADDTPGPALQAHLELCAACREEWRFAEQVAAAVAAMPRHAAPAGFSEQVISTVRDRQAPSQSGQLVTSLLLRPWEMAGACLLCLLGLVAVWLLMQPSIASAAEGSSLGQWLARTGITREGVAAGIRGWSAELQAVWHRLGGAGFDWSGGLLVWGCGALAFSVALYLLLSVSRAKGARTWEDAHA